MNDVIKDLYDIVIERKASPQEGSYTAYLFKEGLDKILKKIGEESAETIIAAKNGDDKLLTEEVCDLLYHLLVMLAEKNIDIERIFDELVERRKKIGNLKVMKNTDRNT